MIRNNNDMSSYFALQPYRCVVIGCLLIDLMKLIDSYGSMIDSEIRIARYQRFSLAASLSVT